VGEPLSLTEILAEIPKLSFAERQELVRRAIEVEDHDLTAEEKTILDERLEDFRRNPNSGIAVEQLKGEVSRRLKPR
jgi:putative addiction module component (TIGR02574 family)